MTTYYYEFAGLSGTNQADWSNPAAWTPEGVPDTVNDGAILSEISEDGHPAPYTVTLGATESVAINSLQVPANFLTILGSLSATDNVNVSATGEIGIYGGSLSAGHIVVNGYGLQGVGTVTSSGSLEIQSQAASGTASAYTGETTLTLSGATFYNSGTLLAGSGTTLLAEATQANGFLNFSNGTLIGGSYAIDSNSTLELKTDGVITTDAAALIITGDYPAMIASYNPNDGEWVNIEVSLSTIAPAGTLSVIGANFAVEFGLTVEGNVQLDQGLLGAHTLSVAPGGVIAYQGNSSQSALSVAAGFLVDNGEIAADASTGASTSLVIQPEIRGSGSVVIGPEVTTTIAGTTFHFTASVTLDSAVSANIVFSDDTGTATLGAPGQFTGAFQGFVKGDSIILSGVGYSSVTGYNYSGSSTAGTLIIDEGSTAIKLAFAGDYMTQDFSLSAGANGSTHVALVGVATG